LSLRVISNNTAAFGTNCVKSTEVPIRTKTHTSATKI